MIFFVLRHLTPVLVRIVLAGTLLMLASLASLWRGFKPSVDAMAHEWTEALVRRLRDTSRTREIYRFFQAVGWIVLATGWVLIAWVTVWFVNLIF
jgi:hypothetical protein